jgi:hypothetical protein
VEALTPVFVHVPKTGGQSITKALGVFVDHMKASDSGDGFRFGFVRHPYARYVSAFQFAKKAGDIPVSVTVDEWVHRLDTREELWRPMSAWLDAPMHFIGRFEYLNEGARYVWACCGLGDVVLPHVNATGPHPELRRDTRAMIDRIYAEDFERFAYGNY